MPACASKQDVLELTTLQYAIVSKNKLELSVHLIKFEYWWEILQCYSKKKGKKMDMEQISTRKNYEIFYQCAVPC